MLCDPAGRQERMKEGWMMKKLITVLVMLLMLAPGAYALQVDFEWGYANPPADLAGFRLYQSNTSGFYKYGADKAVAEIGKEFLAATIDVPDGKWFWVVTAYDAAGNESGPSNEVTLEIDTVPPEAPQNLTAAIKISYNRKTGKYEIKVVRLWQDGKPVDSKRTVE